jgi:hypothetical protein
LGEEEEEGEGEGIRIRDRGEKYTIAMNIEYFLLASVREMYIQKP